MKESIYELVVDVWRLAAKYKFKKMSDAEWESFIQHGKTLNEKYRKKNMAIERLYRDLFDVFQTFYKQLEK